MKTALICAFYDIPDTEGLLCLMLFILQTVKRFPRIWQFSCNILYVFDSVLVTVLLLSLLFSPLFALCRDIIDSYEKKNIYSCQSYEWDRITFVDYAAPLHGAANSWVMLFR